MRFLVDMPLSPDLSAWPSSEGHDAVHASELGLSKTPDIDIMARAKADRRTIVTADLAFPQLLALARATEPGVILFRGGNWSDAQIIDRMRDVLANLTEGEIDASVISVDRAQVRRRKLPIEP